ncbi:UBP-type zinc finger domain-containing protein [Spirosoma aerolatum]|uniref:UBP-type zinc finger domain-containing protein n=1 Tax=Spirosoma aerolatum TaxID=1211326 RepID=UPI0009ACEE42|nr:UBP-type zinc finger domain-containing protein [Spirosoma aerolatum]
MLKQTICNHIASLAELRTAQEYVCEECIRTGSSWVHLRTCQTCGVTLCCDSSPNKHATKHFHRTEHPVIASAEPGERWLWCYVDEQIVSY